jgi:sporulation protein YlmC with PRC-barrel domain
MDLRKWSDMQKIAVFVPSEGRIVGWADDFYFKTESSTIYALRVRTRVEGDRSLPVTGIKAIENSNIALINGQMLTKALPPLPQGGQLRGSKVFSERGDEIGTIGDVLLDVTRPNTLRIAAFEMAGKSQKTFSADEVVSYSDDGSIIIYDRAAKRLR